MCKFTLIQYQWAQTRIAVLNKERLVLLDKLSEATRVQAHFSGRVSTDLRDLYFSIRMTLWSSWIRAKIRTILIPVYDFLGVVLGLSIRRVASKPPDRSK